MAKKIFLWTAPRCVSTAFERSIMELPDTKIFHEPYSRCYHFGPERQSPRYMGTPVDKRGSYDEINKLLTKEYDGIEHLFSKDMAYAVENHFDVLLHKQLQTFQHTFLIRSPKKTVISLYRASINKQLTGWDHFDPVEAGHKQMWNLYCFIKEKFQQKPVVIDADDLLTHPKETMEAYCNATQLPFIEGMLKWEPGPIPDWDLWSGWHENALKSSGFEKQDPESLKINDEEITSYPTEVQTCIAESLLYYNRLKSHKLNPIGEMIC